jgi:hypothetical protein
MLDDLASILSGETPVVEEAQIEEQAVDTVENTNPEEKGVKEDKQEEKPPVSEPEQKEESKSWTQAMAIDERRKRQELERKNQELLAEIAGLKAPKQEEQKANRPDVFENPEQAFAYSEQLAEKKAFQRLVKLTEEDMREKHEDYEEMSNHFMKMASENPMLTQQLFNAANPAKFAYQIARNSIEMQKFNDPTYKESLKAQMKNEILAELVSKQQVTEPTKSDIELPDFSKATSAKSGDKFPNDKSLEELFPPLNNRKK